MTLEIENILPVVKICGIYKITSPTNKVYIGQSTNIIKRFLVYKRLRCKRQPKLYNSLKKYGIKKHKFEILHTCRLDQLNSLEKHYITLYQTFDSEKGLNLRDGGGAKGKHSDISKRKMSEVSYNRPPMSEETKRKISESLKGNTNGIGKKHSEETKKRFSETRKGRIPWNKGKTGIYSEETIRKIKEARKRQVITEESKKKQSETAKARAINKGMKNGMFGRTGASHPGAKPYALISPEGKIFKGVGLSTFCKENNLCQSKVWSILNEKRNHHKRWRKFKE